MDVVKSCTIGSDHRTLKIKININVYPIVIRYEEMKTKYKWLQLIQSKEKQRLSTYLKYCSISAASVPSTFGFSKLRQIIIDTTNPSLAIKYKLLSTIA